MWKRGATGTSARTRITSSPRTTSSDAGGITRMGYDLHITRRKEWIEEGDDITFEEFVRQVQGDVEFRYPGENGDDYADWHSSKSGYESWLGWSDGQIHTKNPEPEFIDKMIAVARELHAKVQGDDGEVYLSATEIQKQAGEPTVETICQRTRAIENNTAVDSAREGQSTVLEIEGRRWE